MVDLLLLLFASTRAIVRSLLYIEHFGLNAWQYSRLAAAHETRRSTQFPEACFPGSFGGNGGFKGKSSLHHAFPISPRGLRWSWGVAMARRQGSESETEDFHSLPSPGLQDDGDAEGGGMEPPVHPVRSMQGAFEESIVESTEGSKPKPSMDLNAEERRRRLLDSSQYDDSWTARWRQKKHARYHPCEKLISQIIFGLHLLQQQQAKSEEEVVKILQTHVNEIDTFLERTAEDFQLAINDIDERIRFLKLPMAHQSVFETMLDDKKFRTQLLDGNEKIVTIIDRTTKAMNASMLDIHNCNHANRELGKYLDMVQHSWPKSKRGVAEVYGAMRGNEHGWTRYLKDLQTKGNDLGRGLSDLANVVGDMSKMATLASKRSKKAASSGSKSAPTSPGLRSKFSDHSAPPLPSPPGSSDLNKPLPKNPHGLPAAISNAATKATAVSSVDRSEKTGHTPKSSEALPTRTSSLQRKAEAEDPPRPKTAGARPTAREARAADSRANTLELMAFLKSDTNPLRMNPPEDAKLTSIPRETQKKVLGKSQSHSVDLLVDPRPKTANANEKVVVRSKSQGTLDILKAADEAKAQARAQIQAHTRAKPSMTPSMSTSMTGSFRPSQDMERPSMDTGASSMKR